MSTTTVISGPFTQIAADSYGSGVICGLHADGTAACAAKDPSVQGNGIPTVPAN
jgi:hypothetical protein